MLWFYARNGDSMQLETRYDNDTLEYVGILTHPDGHQEVQRFATGDDFTAWLTTLEASLTAGQWTLTGSPQILPDGWPNKNPTR